MKAYKINLKILNSSIFFFLLLQIFLIAHRNSFSFNLLINFYKKNAGVEQGIKSAEIFSILEIIKKNNLDSFKLSEDLLQSRKIKQRVFEAAYPVRHKRNSINFITKKKIRKDCAVKDKINNIYLLNCE